MTDNEIIKALECCVNDHCHKCERFKVGDSRVEHKDKMLKDAFDLINRQKAEIERLMPFGTQVEVSKKIEAEIKSEAIKEFAERLKEKSWIGMWETVAHIDVDDIDNLVKEMTEQSVNYESSKTDEQ